MESRQQVELAAFCKQLPQVRRVARQHGLSGVLEDVVAEARAGAPVGELLPRLGISGGLGELGSGRRGDAGMNVPGLVNGRSLDEVYVCPAGMCARHVEREPGGPIPPIPHCGIHGAPLQLARRK